jgi:hypothetical protein
MPFFSESISFSTGGPEELKQSPLCKLYGNNPGMFTYQEKELPETAMA